MHGATIKITTASFLFDKKYTECYNEVNTELLTYSMVQGPS